MQRKKGFPPLTVAETTLVFGWKRGTWDIRVWSQPFARIQLGDLAQFVFVETEIEHIDIFSDARGGNGFRDYHQTGIQMPADHNLRRRFAVFQRELTDQRLLEYPLSSLCQWTPGLGLNLVRGIPGV